MTGRTLSDVRDDLSAMRELADMLLGESDGVALYAGGSTGRWLLTEPADPDDPLRPGARVQVAYMDAGQGFEVHAHDRSTEILTVLSGVLDVTVEEGDTYPLAPGSCLSLAPGQLHSAVARTACAVLGTTVPADRGYPSGPDRIEPGPAE